MTTPKMTIVVPLVLAQACIVWQPANAPRLDDEPREIIPIDDGPPVVAEAGETCTVIRRKTDGEVRDAHVSASFPAKNFGASQVASTGAMPNGGSEREMLVKFDLPDLPRGAAVTHARITLYRAVGGGPRVSVHPMSNAWNEAEVTWHDVEADDDGEIAVIDHTPEPGWVSFDVTALARKWADGAPNHGLVLRRRGAPNGTTAFATSESPRFGERPKLDLCYIKPQRRG